MGMRQTPNSQQIKKRKKEKKKKNLHVMRAHHRARKPGILRYRSRNHFDVLFVLKTHIGFTSLSKTSVACILASATGPLVLLAAGSFAAPGFFLLVLEDDTFFFGGELGKV
jgi:hypothetical protein